MHIAKPVEPLELVLTVATLAAKPKDSDNDLVGAAAVLPAEKSPGDPLRILLVEDHQATREVLTRLLGRRGHVVIAAGSLAKARAAAENEKFDLVISDLGLPDGSGITLMTELRDRFGLKGIALSGFGEADDFSRTEEAGFVTHLIKPVSIGALQAALAAATTAPRKL
jgi:CheY-like chemotaxis protein